MLSIMTYILSSKISFFLRHSLKYGLHLVQGAKTEPKCLAIPIWFVSLLYQRDCLPGQDWSTVGSQSSDRWFLFSSRGMYSTLQICENYLGAKAWPFTPTSPSLSISCSSSSQKVSLAVYFLGRCSPCVPVDCRPMIDFVCSITLLLVL